MRLVCMADTHMFHDELVVPEGDVLIHAGDMGRGGGLLEMERAAAFLRALPHPEKIVVAGNHDRAFEREPEVVRGLFSGMRYLEDSGTELAGVSFWGSPWQPEFHQWAFNLPRGRALAEKWALIPPGIDVLITHGPPLGFGDVASDGRGTGCADLLARVRVVRPKLHLFGHIHEGRGTWRSEGTLFANTTTWECELPCMVLDFDEKTGEFAVVVG